MKGMGRMAFALLLAAGAAAGQWVEAVITLPDTMTGIDNVRAIAEVEATRSLYVGGSGGCVIIVDRETNLKRRKVAIPVSQVSRFAHVPSAGKVYCGGYGASVLPVLDVAGESLLGVVDFPSPVAFFVHPDGERLYVASWLGEAVGVLDIATDSIVRVLPMGGEVGTFCYLPGEDRLYCGGDAGTVVIVDCATDSVVGEIPVPYGAGSMLYLPERHVVYCGDRDNYYVRVIDCAIDSVVGRIFMDEACTQSQMIRCERVNKVYCLVFGERVSVIDPTADSVLSTIPGLVYPVSMAWDPDDGRLYVAGMDFFLYVVDGTADTVAWEFRSPHSPNLAAYSGSTRSAYFLVGDPGSVLVFDEETGRLQASIGTDTDWMLSGVCCLPSADRLYCSGLHGTSLVAYEAAGLSPAAHLAVWPEPVDVCPAEDLGKLYVASDDSLLTVIDVAGDSVLTEVAVGLDGDDEPRTRMWYNPGTRKLYCIAREDDGTWIVDCEGDSVVAVFPGGHEVIVGSAAHNRVYVDRPGGLAVIEGTGDTLLATIDVEARAASLARRGQEEELAVVSYDDLVLFVDPANDSVVGSFRYYRELAAVPPGYSPRVNRFYFGETQDHVLAVDGRTHRVVRRIDVGGRPRVFLYSQGTDRMYCGTSRGTAVIDCRTDSVIARLECPADFLAADPGHGRIFAGEAYGATLAVIRDRVGIEETPRCEVQVANRPTVISGILRLPEAVGVLLNPLGRRVMDLGPGENDVRGLSPGVYFVCPASGVGREASSVHKVVLTR